MSLVYLGYIIILSSSEEEHCPHLPNMLKLLQQADLTAKLEKYHFGRQKIKYLGFRLRQKGVSWMKQKPKQLKACLPLPP